MSRVCNSLVTGQTATDLVHYSAFTVGWAQTSIVVRAPNRGAPSRARAENGKSFVLGVCFCNKRFFREIYNPFHI